MSMTMAEKILARTSGQNTTEAGQFVTAKADRMMANDMFIVCAKIFKDIGLTELNDPDKLVVVFDHVFPAPSAKHADMIKSSVSILEQYKVNNYLGYPGVSHQVMCERGYVLPGQLVMGTDSHSTMYGALGAAGAGIGATEMAYLLATGELWFQVPQTERIDLVGTANPGFTAKDLVLHVIGKFGGDFGQYKAIEYGGEVAERMTISERMTIANMGAEIGAKFAMFEADQRTVDYVQSRTSAAVQTFAPDPDANYIGRHTIDISDLAPQVACPHSPDNVKPITEVTGTPVNQAYLGSCTNARLDDLAIGARVLKGQKVAATTRLLVAPSSQQVLLDATKAGYIETLVEAGAHILPSGCGACAGLHLGLLGAGETCISSTNRNFPGRMGSVGAEVYLGSPATVAASAITGVITDPREFWQDRSLSHSTSL